jgi:hypothetical protein
MEVPSFSTVEMTETERLTGLLSGDLRVLYADIAPLASVPTGNLRFGHKCLETPGGGYGKPPYIASQNVGANPCPVPGWYGRPLGHGLWPQDLPLSQDTEKMLSEMRNDVGRLSVAADKRQQQVVTESQMRMICQFARSMLY